MNASGPLASEPPHRAAASAHRDTFIAGLYQGVTLADSFAAIATSVASELSVDRVSLLKREPNRWRLVATSTQPKVDSRTRQVRLLERFVLAAMRESESITFELGAKRRTPSGVDAELDAYLDESGCRELHLEAINAADDQPAAVCIVVERFRRLDEMMTPIADVLKPMQSLLAGAVNQAIQRHDCGWILLAAQWFHNRSSSPSWRQRFAGVLTGCVVLLCIATWVPLELTIPVEGRVVARHQRHIFAPTNGQIVDVRISDNASVTNDQVLLTIRSPELDRLLQSVRGDLSTAQTRLDSLLASRSRERGGMAEVEEQTLRSEIVGLQSQLDLLKMQQKELTVRSPIPGRIDRWDLEQTLAGRPVVRGQFLIDIVSVSDGFDAELEIPDRDMGDVLAAANAAGKLSIECSLRLRSDPTQSFEGEVDRMGHSTHQIASGQSVVTARVPLKLVGESGLRSGATLVASLHCGKARAGYVWFRGVIHWWRGLEW